MVHVNIVLKGAVKSKKNKFTNFELIIIRFNLLMIHIVWYHRKCLFV